MIEAKEKDRRDNDVDIIYIVAFPVVLTFLNRLPLAYGNFRTFGLVL